MNRSAAQQEIPFLTAFAFIPLWFQNSKGQDPHRPAKNGLPERYEMPAANSAPNTYHRSFDN